MPKTKRGRKPNAWPMASQPEADPVRRQAGHWMLYQLAAPILDDLFAPPPEPQLADWLFGRKVTVALTEDVFA